MKDRMVRPGQEAPQPDSLERLLEAEAAIDARLRSCLAEAEAIVETARQEAARLGRQLEAELREGRAEQIRAREASFADAIQDERDRAAHDIRRLRGVPSDRVDALARSLIARLLEGAT